MFKFALKSIKKHKVPSAINALGFTIGVVGAVILFAILKHDLYFDTYHKQYQSIQRLSIKLNLPNGERHFASTSVITADDLVESIPEIRESIRMRIRSANLTFGEKVFNNEPISYVDQGFYEAFTIELMSGSLPSKPNEMLISAVAKERLFGDESAVGKILRDSGQPEGANFIIAGVFKNFPTNVSFRPVFLTGFQLIEDSHNKNYGAIMPFLNTFLLVDSGIATEDLQEKLDAFYSERLPEGLNEVLDHRIEPYAEMHYSAGKEFDFASKHDKQTQWVLMLLAIFILVSTLVNFFNMQTALMVQRFKELSIKAALGQTFSTKVLQTIFESLIVLLPSFLIAGVSIHFILNELEAYTSLSLRTSWLSPETLPLLMLFGFFIFWLITSAISISLMQVSSLNLGVSRSKPVNTMARRTLIGFQFALAGFFIFNALVVSNQLNFINQLDLGYEETGMINLPLQDIQNYEQVRQIKNNIGALAGIRYVTATQSSIFGAQGKANFSMKQDTSDVSHLLNVNFIDEDFLKTSEMTLLAGSDIRANENKLFINESAAELLGFQDYELAVGQQLNYSARDTSVVYEISGVLGDYHYSTMHQLIEPIVLLPTAFGGYYNLTVRTEGNDYESIIASLEDLWVSLFPGYQLNYRMLEEVIDNAYEEDFQKGEFYQWSTFLLVLISALGIFGLTYYHADQKRKEIGLRKAIGAQLGHILLQVAKPISWVCLIAILICIPLAYYISEQWLSGYQYAVEVGVTSVLITIVLMFGLSLIALLYPGLKASTINPVEALREE